MNSLTDSHDEDLRTATPNREINLGTSLLLGIFFAIAGLCAAFFGFGYSLGAKHTSAITVAAEAQPSLRLNGTKPSAGSMGADSRPGAGLSSKPEVMSPRPPAETETVDSTNSVDSTPTLPPAQTQPQPIRAHAPAAAAPPPPSPAIPSSAGATQFLVQIAAVTHQEDADLIASTLTRRGYAVNVRSETQDKLLHVQVGPFPSKKDAEAMRQRLMADGFNAYIK